MFNRKVGGIYVTSVATVNHGDPIAAEKPKERKQSKFKEDDTMTDREEIN